MSAAAVCLTSRMEKYMFALLVQIKVPIPGQTVQVMLQIKKSLVIIAANVRRLTDTL